MTKKITKKEHPLVNMFFVVLKNGKPNQQGFVTRKVDNDHFMIKYFSYLDGGLMEGEEVVPYKKMEGWKFFKTAKEVRELHYKLGNWDKESIKACEWIVKHQGGL